MERVDDRDRVIADRPTRAGRLALGVAAVGVVAFAVHGRSIGFEFAYLDDDVLIVEQQDALTRPSALWRAFGRPYFQPSGRDHAYYRPVIGASYAFDALRGGADPTGYHLTNVVVHALAAVLVALLLRRLGHRERVAWFGGLLYAVHPALTEAVAWIPGRNDSLLAVFSLAAWLLFLRGDEPGRHLARVGHAVAWLLALLCKETALVLPFVILAHRAFIARRPPPPWFLATFVGALGVYLAARAAVLPDQLGAAGAHAASFFERASGLVTTLGKLILPVNLAVLATPADTSLAPGVAALALVAAGVFVLRAHRRPLLFALAASAAFIAPTLPTSGLLALESRLALPAVAIVLFACEIAARLPGNPRVHGALAGALILVLAAATLSYGGNFRDRMTFARAAVDGSPHSALAHRNLGVALQVAGQLDPARRAYEQALALDPEQPVVHNNLAVMLMAQGRLAEAERHLHIELAVNPDYVPAQTNLARVRQALGR
jgi:tetratricopeptide (TPR) repeat protein